MSHQEFTHVVEAPATGVELVGVALSLGETAEVRSDRERRLGPIQVVAGFSVNASSIPDDESYAVWLSCGDLKVASITRVMTPADARALGSALIAAADHYDAETARLQAVSP